MSSAMSRARALSSTVAITLLGLPLLTQLVDAATTADPDDIKTLNAAIELERAGIKAYDDALASGVLDGHEVLIARQFRSDHQAHRDALIAAVRAAGATPSETTPNLGKPASNSVHDIFLFAKSVEEKAASTYLSVIADFKDRRLATVAASILGIETTHVSLLAYALSQFPAYPSPFLS